MSSKAQGAMEYLLSYGWAILVVMIVGAALWQLGILSPPSSAATSSGFSTLKPFLATCKAGPDAVWWTTFSKHGAYCQFANAAGDKIAIVDLNLTINNDSCRDNVIATQATYSNPTWSELYRIPTAKCCFDFGSANRCIPSSGSCGAASRLVLDNGQTFTVSIAGRPGASDNVGICRAALAPGQRYAMNVDITYEISVGGVITQQHSIGTVYVTAL
jgi:hypothetical protein